MRYLVEKMKLELLTTEHCGLCEQALDLLLSMPETAGFELTVIDIVDGDVLFDRYASLIPVLKVAEAELCAPFGHAEVVRWLGEIADP